MLEEFYISFSEVENGVKTGLRNCKITAGDFKEAKARASGKVPALLDLLLKDPKTVVEVRVEAWGFLSDRLESNWDEIENHDKQTRKTKR